MNRREHNFTSTKMEKGIKSGSIGYSERMGTPDRINSQQCEYELPRYDDDEKNHSFEKG
jgi:hypothetical protein